MEEFIRQFYAEIERRLIEKIKQIEGRVPSNDEAREHGHTLVYPDGKQEFQWKGVTILVVHPIAYDERIQNFVRKMDF